MTTRTSVDPVSAHDVVIQIVESHDAFESIWAVIYTETQNWIDQVEESRLTTSKLRAAVRQDSGPRKLVELSRSDVVRGRLRQLEEGLSQDQLLGIISRVRLSGNKLMHIPMMDFRCAITDSNLRFLSQLMPEIGQRHGFILQSGRSYHFYGTEMLNERAWTQFLGKCLLLTTFTDERYIGHQLVDGHCVLRLSTGRLKPVNPTVVSAF